MHALLDLDLLDSDLLELKKLEGTSGQDTGWSNHLLPMALTGNRLTLNHYG